MKEKLVSLIALFSLGVGCSTQPQVTSQNNKPASRATPAATQEAESAHRGQAMKELRDTLLASSSPEDLGLSAEDAKAKVWGVMMEVSFATGPITLFSLRDGTASLYTSTGGIMGGYSAKNEAKRFVVEAEKHLASMKREKSFPYPEVGRMKFYALTPGGVYTAETGEDEVVHGRNALSPLFAAGNDVLTALRIANQRVKPN